MNDVSLEEIKTYVAKEYPLGIGGDGYKKNLIKFLKTVVGRPVHSNYLLEIPSKNKLKQNYSYRRWEEIYSLDKLPFINWNSIDGKKMGLNKGQWCLLSDKPLHSHHKSN